MSGRANQVVVVFETFFMSILATERIHCKVVHGFGQYLSVHVVQFEERPHFQSDGDAFIAAEEEKKKRGGYILI